MRAPLRTPAWRGLAAFALAAPGFARAEDPPAGKPAPEASEAGKLLAKLKSGRPDFARAASEGEALAAHIESSVKLADEIVAVADATAEQKSVAGQQKLFLLHYGANKLKDPELKAKAEGFRKQFDAFCTACQAAGPKTEMAGFVVGLAALDRAAATPPSIAETMAFFKDFPKHPFAGDVATAAASAVAEAGALGVTNDLAAARKTIAEIKAAAPADAAEEIAGILKEMEIVGTEMEIVGPTIAGKEFDIKSLNGKVVLVDFWATWCGPCVQEMPNVKKAYDRYHAKGFEVVGVSLDNEQAALVEFVKENKIPWVQVFHKPPEGKEDWANPLAKKYEVQGIPAMFLLGKDGKVVSRNVRGEALEKALARLLGPAEDKPADANKPAAKTGG